MDRMPPVPSDATDYILSELTRRLNEVASRLETGLLRLDQVYVRSDVYEQWKKTAEAEHEKLIADRAAAVLALQVADKANEDRIKKLEESRQWLFRACVGGLISGLISMTVTVILVVTGAK